MIVLQTTANFPDIMLQIYQKNRFAAIYFVLFLVLNNILLVNMMLSIFYINYKALMEEKTKKILKENKYLTYFFFNNINNNQILGLLKNLLIQNLFLWTKWKK